MVTKNFLILVTLSLSPSSFAAEGAQVPADASSIIRQMAGCFSVSFNYVEDGEHDAFYQAVLEKAQITNENPLTLTRTLIVGGVEQKHWSDAWTQVDGVRWRQHVEGPFGDFRYACEGNWLMNQWSCEAVHAPKPRRDADRPYSFLDRLNQLQVNGRRWVHGQVNRKINADSSLYGVEMGWNIYERVEDSRCVLPKN